MVLPIESTIVDHLSDAGSSLAKAGLEFRDVVWGWLVEMGTTASNSVDTVDEVAEKSIKLTSDGAGHGLEISGNVAGKAAEIIANTGELLQNHDKQWPYWVSSI